MTWNHKELPKWLIFELIIPPPKKNPKIYINIVCNSNSLTFQMKAIELSKPKSRSTSTGSTPPSPSTPSRGPRIVKPVARYQPHEKPHKKLLLTSLLYV